MAKKRKGVYARDVDQLNVLFGIVSIVCLLSVLWMIWDDYAKPWKSYQRQFRVIQAEVTEQQLQETQAQMDQARLSELRQQREAAEQALAERQDEIAELEDQIASLQTRLDLADQNMRFARSIYDTERWEFEEARKEHGEEDAAGAREQMESAAADVEQYTREVEQLTLEQEALQARLDEMRSGAAATDTEIIAMTREIDRLQGRLDELRFDIPYYLRNAPFLDGFNPSLRIRQVVLGDIPFDLNFTAAPRVDRCQTCHLGINSGDYESYDQPFASHPRLDLFVADTSAHPMGTFGCTVCHGGKGHATSFTSAVHTPDNESEEERWEDELGWHHVELWEWPMRPGDEIESGCLKCHVGDEWLPDAPRLEYGLELVEKLGCYGCHQLDRWDDARKRGPDLTHIASKTDPEWAYNWVMDPKSFRPDTPMPRFFGLENNSGGYWDERNQVEADAIVAYLFDASTAIELESAGAGNAARGQQLVESVGCLGCHMIGEYEVTDESAAANTRFTGYRHAGPNLAGIGSKVDADWLYTWVRNPTHYFPETSMPDLRLTESEAADVAAYLSGLTDPEWEEPQIPAVDAELRYEVAFEYLRQQMPTPQAEERLAAMSEEEKRHYLGERLISRYGCSGCHVIPGFENAGRIGTSLSQWGSKAVAQMDFGLLDLPHERRAFLEQKLRAPRSYDRGRERSSQEMLRMPNFDLEPDEIGAIATAILGFTDAAVQPAAMPADTGERQTIEAGRRIVDRYNCRGCHIVEERGGAIREVIAEQKLADGEVASLAAGLVFGPPNLRSQGARVQPDWLYRFLASPTIVRPWLEVRMPTFPFTDRELNDLTAYFATLDDVPYPFEETFTTAHSYPQDLVAAGRDLAADRQGSLQCLSCHFQGGQQPRVQPTQWAPDLAIASERLRPQWIDRWLKNPQELQPGTNMPQFWQSLEPGSSFYDTLNRDPQTQIDAIVAYIMSLGR